MSGPLCARPPVWVTKADNSRSAFPASSAPFWRGHRSTRAARPKKIQEARNRMMDLGLQWLDGNDTVSSLEAYDGPRNYL